MTMAPLLVSRRTRVWPGWFAVAFSEGGRVAPHHSTARVQKIPASLLSCSDILRSRLCIVVVSFPRARLDILQHRFDREDWRRLLCGLIRVVVCYEYPYGRRTRSAGP